MRNIVLLSLLFSLAGCGGPSIENSSEPVNDQVNAASANISEGSGRNELDPPALGPTSSQRGLMPQEPPRGGQ